MLKQLCGGSAGRKHLLWEQIQRVQESFKWGVTFGLNFAEKQRGVLQEGETSCKGVRPWGSKVCIENKSLQEKNAVHSGRGG